MIPSVLRNYNSKSFDFRVTIFIDQWNNKSQPKRQKTQGKLHQIYFKTKDKEIWKSKHSRKVKDSRKEKKKLKEFKKSKEVKMIEKLFKKKSHWKQEVTFSKSKHIERVNITEDQEKRKSWPKYHR